MAIKESKEVIQARIDVTNAKIVFEQKKAAQSVANQELRDAQAAVSAANEALRGALRLVTPIVDLQAELSALQADLASVNSIALPK